MPHLSPMNWIMSIISFWLILLIISSNYWWNQTNKFSSSKSTNMTPSPSSWKW